MSGHRKSLLVVETEAAASSSSSSSMQRVRGSWNPVWMDDNQWLSRFEVDDYLLHAADPFTNREEDCDDEEMTLTSAAVDNDGMDEGGDMDEGGVVSSNHRGRRRSVSFAKDVHEPDHQKSLSGGGGLKRGLLSGIPLAASSSDTESSSDSGNEEGDAARDNDTDRLHRLFYFAAKAILQPSPDTGSNAGDAASLGKPRRKALLAALLRRVLERASHPQQLGTRVKETLRTIQNEDVAADLFAHFSSYMSGAPWESYTNASAFGGPRGGASHHTSPASRQRRADDTNLFEDMKKIASKLIPSRWQRRHAKDTITGGADGRMSYYDAYRSVGNFYTNGELWRQFREECDALVQQKLHAIEKDVSRSEAKITRAISMWHTMRNAATNHEMKEEAIRCFGNALHVEMRDIVLDAAPTMQEAQMTTTDDGVEIIEAFKKVVPKTRRLPSKVSVAVTLFTTPNDTLSTSISHEVRGEPPLQLEYGKRLSWVRTRPVTFVLGNARGVSAGLRPETCSLRIEVRRLKPLWSCASRAGDLLAEFDVRLMEPLFSKMARFDDVVRHDLGEHAGLHAQRVECTDALRGVTATLDLYLHCLDPSHRERPPAIDVEKEEEKRRLAIQAIRDDVWKADHHACFRELADLLGELDEDGSQVLQLYAEKYLIHEELRQAVFLSNLALQSDFSNPDDRDVIETALRGLMGIRGSITTVISAKLVDSTLSTVRKQAVERLLTLEFVTKSPAEAGDAFTRLRSAISICGVSAADLNAMLTRRIVEEAKPVAQKFSKINKIVSRGISIAQKTAAADLFSNDTATLLSRQSVLPIIPELEALPDKHTLAAKGRVLVELTQSLTEPLVAALTYAKLAGNAGVAALVAFRVETWLRECYPPLQSCVSTLAQAMVADPSGVDPFSDSCGMLVAVYESVMGLVDTAQDGPCANGLDASLLKLVQLIEPFFPMWFYMCKRKQDSLVHVLVSQEPLDPVMPGKIFANHLPADCQRVIDSLLLVFMKVLRWSNPSTTAPVHVPSFVGLIVNFVEEVAVELREAAEKESVELSESVVALCTHVSLSSMLETFWSDVIDSCALTIHAGQQQPDSTSAAPVSRAVAAQRGGRKGLQSKDPSPESSTPPLAEAPPVATSQRKEEDLLIAKCMAHKAAAATALDELLHAHISNIARKLRSALFPSLKLLLQTEDDVGGGGAVNVTPFMEQHTKELVAELRFLLDESIGVALPPPLAKHQTGAAASRGVPPAMVRDKSPPTHAMMQVAPEVREVCIAAVYDALADFGLTFAATPLSPGRKSQLMRVIEVFENEIRRIWPDYSGAGASQSPSLDRQSMRASVARQGGFSISRQSVLAAAGAFQQPAGYVRDPTILAQHVHRARSVVLWLCHTSAQLEHILRAVLTDDMSDPSEELLLETLQKNGDFEVLSEIARRRNDKDMQKFVKSVSL